MADATCTLQCGGAVTTVPVGLKVKVRYLFDTTTRHDLALPYAVAIDGKVLPDYAKKVRALDSSRQIELTVTPGSQVALFLNSDAYPRFRQHPVYRVTASSNDMVVHIKEKNGKHLQLQPEIGQPVLSTDNSGKTTETYRTWLTGDIWMRISHRYTWDEAQALIPAGLPAPIVATLRLIYTGMGATTMFLDFPASDSSPALLIKVQFLPQENVSSNIELCQLENGALPRVHPAAYAALFSAAHAVRLTRLTINSGWRPMFGSIAHRAGLGLDINFIASSVQTVKLNRESLKSPTMTVNGENVTATERNLYREYQQAKEDQAIAGKASEKARKALATNKDPAQTTALKSVVDLKEGEASEAKKLTKSSKKKWDDERNSTEPLLTTGLRQALSSNPIVSQLLDPWYIDTNTHDKIAASANEQISDSEHAHNNHLHITLTASALL